MGLGRDAADALMFRKLDGSYLLPHSIRPHGGTRQRALTISRCLVRGSAAITWWGYGHLFRATDDRAAAMFESAFGGVLGK